MITRIEVNGFKSLAKFSLNLQAGLNVLVGPNGGGKTNIVLFLSFFPILSGLMFQRQLVVSAAQVQCSAGLVIPNFRTPFRRLYTAACQ